MKKNRIVKVGNLKIGGGHPVRVKGMLKASADNPKALIKEARQLEKEGAEAVRVAVLGKKNIRLGSLLKKYISIPVAADIHFQPELALLAIKEGFDQIRLNPLNISRKKDVKEIAKFAKEKKVPVRVGINSGGFKKGRISSAKMAREMVKRCIDYIGLLESQGLFDIIVSLKTAEIESTVLANELFTEQSQYPLHLGITATGSYLEGLIKSAEGIGILLNKGIGNIIRVSLTGPSLSEIQVAKYILQYLKLRKFGPEIISCPTCSRCQIDLVKVVNSFKIKLDKLGLAEPIKIAVMGCAVNGPGEASQADLGVAFGEKKGIIFRKGKVLGWSRQEKIISDLMEEVKKYGLK